MTWKAVSTLLAGIEPQPPAAHGRTVAEVGDQPAKAFTDNVDEAQHAEDD